MNEKETMEIWVKCKRIAKEEIYRIKHTGFQSPIWASDDLIQEAGVTFSKLLSYYPNKQGNEFLRIFRVSFRNRLTDICRRERIKNKYFVNLISEEDNCPWWEKVSVLPGQEEHLILKEEMEGEKK